MKWKIEQVLKIVALVVVLTCLMNFTKASAAEIHTVRPVGAVVKITEAQSCVTGYSASVRPPANYTNKIKKSWTPVGHTPSEYELDHFIPISIGGDPRSTNNLWMQTLADAKRKDVLEINLHKQVCSGKLTLKQAQERMLNWK